MNKPRIKVKKAIHAIENDLQEQNAPYSEFIKIITKEETKRRQPNKGDWEKLFLASIALNISEKDNNKRFDELEERMRNLEQIVHQCLTKIDFSNEASLDKLISSDPTLKKYCEGKQLSLASKRLLVQNRFKLEKLYQTGQHKINVKEYTGTLKISDTDIADDILK